MIIPSLLKKMAASGLIATALIGGAALAPSLIASAETNNPPVAATVAPTAKTATANQRLEKLFALELKVQARQTKRIENTGTIISRTLTFIDKQQSSGKDVSGLKAALEGYRDQVGQARTAHEAAADILQAHAGFTDGQVTDAASARTTVRNAATRQDVVATWLNKAGVDLKDLIRIWRDNHR